MTDEQAVCVIEINDAALTAVNAGGLLAASPGYAVVDRQTLLVGEAARDCARINPRSSFNRFWAELDQQPLRRPALQARSHADLAYFHLQALKQVLDTSVQEFVLAVPGRFSTEQLALLLGIAQSLNMAVTGLVSAPVLAAATHPAQGEMRVLDAGLHSISETRIQADDGLALGQSQELWGQGLASLSDIWAGHIARRFVQDARFDPLHDARIEQQLYQQLPVWLQTLRGAPALRAELVVGQRQHRIDLTAAELAQAAAAAYGAIRESVAAHGAQLRVSERIAALPGLFSDVDCPPVYDAVSLGNVALAHLQQIRSDADAPAYVTRLEVQAGVATPQPSPAPVNEAADPAAPAPTHLLQGYRARPLAAVADLAGARLQAATNGYVLTPAAGAMTRVNDVPVREQIALNTDDHIEVNGRQWRLITVEQAVKGDGS